MALATDSCNYVDGVCIPFLILRAWECRKPQFSAPGQNFRWVRRSAGSRTMLPHFHLLHRLPRECGEQVGRGDVERL